MAKQTINVGTSPNDKTGDPIRDAFTKVNDNFDELYTPNVLIESITVGGAEYPLLEDALSYFLSLPNGADITIMLPDGLHLMDKGALEWNSSYIELTVISSKTLRLHAINLAQNPNVIISVKPSVANNKALTMFEIINTGHLQVRGVKFDVVSGGYTNVNNTSCITSERGNILYSYYIVIDSFTTGIFMEDGGSGYFWDLNMTTCELAFSINDNVTLLINGPFSATNCNYDSSISDHSFIIFKNTITITGANFNLPLNEIQYDGSYISDNTTALVHKDAPQTLTGSITKTVGSGKDFADINAAISWINNNIFINAYVYLVFDDGIHKMKIDGFFGLSLSNLSFLQLRSSSGNQTACTITVDSTTTYIAYHHMFDVYSGKFELLQITIDPELDGYAGGYQCFSIYGKSGNITVQSSTIKNGYMGIALDKGAGLYTHNSIYDGTKYNLYIIGEADIRSCSIINSVSIGIYVDYSGKASLDTTTFSGNTSDTNFPLNEIQYSGSYISDNTSALSFKA